MVFTNKDAVIMCTGCPGVPAKLNAKSGQSNTNCGQTELTEDDKDIMPPFFGVCFTVPKVPPSPCKPKLGNWTNIKSDKEINGKKVLLFPNTITCTAYPVPGVISMVYGGQIKNIEGAAEGKIGDKDCGWKDCMKEHVSNIDYPGDGVTSRSSLKEWIHPGDILNTIYPIQDYDNQVTKNRTRIINGKPTVINDKNYKTQRHHVIPVNVFAKLPSMSHNLKLISFDINDEFSNGINLPFNYIDMVWHDLQAHRGSHPKYDKSVLKKMKNLEKSCIKYCIRDTQWNLLKEVNFFVKKFRDHILNWDSGYILHNASRSNRATMFLNHTKNKVASSLTRKYFY